MVPMPHNIGDRVSDPTVTAARVSVLDMFRVGIGPSSSHTVGPMRAARAFALDPGLSDDPRRITVDLLGSLGATGRGHNTDRAVLLGLEGNDPATVPTERIEEVLPRLAATGALALPTGKELAFDLVRDLRFLPRERLPHHANSLRITAFDSTGKELLRRTYYSVGGGFVHVDLPGSGIVPLAEQEPDASAPSSIEIPHPFATAAELLSQCERSSRSIPEVIAANETATTPGDTVNAHLDTVAATMLETIARGTQTSGILPGGLDVTRRAPALADHLRTRHGHDHGERNIDWINLCALAVCEENAAGHRIVTAPTNGAAGIVPAVLAYLIRHVLGIDEGHGTSGIPTPLALNAPRVRAATRDYLLTAAAIGALIKTNASIAGAEVGCQGEVGSASAMAAGGLAQTMGGTPEQVENAAEIAMEHSLGLTCDPVGGLVQIPCIERNAIAAVTAVNAARMALWGDGRHAVTLDQVIETMRQTGADMLSKYKETSEGGLAVNVVEC